MPERPTVFVCRGSHCRRHHNKELKALYECLEPVADVEDVRCQRVCDGPLVGTAVDGTLEWFCRMDSEKARANLVELIVEGAAIRKPLEKRHVEKRSGELR